MKTVFVGLSGGVDSAVSAYLLKKEGFNVVGVYMKNWSGDDFGIQTECPWIEDMEVAQKVAEHLGIEFRSYNFELEYRDKVVEYFFDEYSKGRTPNPDVMCNKEIKFNLFLHKSMSDGADLIATGHYASILKDEKGFSNLLKGVDNTKDQSYFLYAINQDQISKSIFPVGNLEKKVVRQIALGAKLPNAKKPDSQGICFIGHINVRDFIRERLGEKEGEIIDIGSGKIVGKHNGAHFFTIGQREGIGIGGTAEPYFVVGTDIKANIVYVGMGTNNPNLYSSKLKIENLHLINPEYKYDKNNLTASIRYRHKPVKIKQINETEYEFEESQRAITTGQSLVIYEGDICLGGGVIESVESNLSF